MQGIKEQATLNEIVLNDTDVIELVVNPGIKKLIVMSCPKNRLTNFNLL